MTPAADRRRRLRGPALIALLAWAAAGCGVADYEKKMQEAEARAQRFDEENQYLGDPLLLPGHTDKEEGAPLDVFLRPPRGVAPKDATRPGELPYHYAAAGGACTDLYLTFGTKGEGREQLEKTIGGLLGGVAPAWRQVEIRPPFGRPAVAFDAAEFPDPRAPAADPAVFLAYVHQGAGLPAVGVVYRVLQSARQKEKADAVVRMSLETFAEVGRRAGGAGRLRPVDGPVTGGYLFG